MISAWGYFLALCITQAWTSSGVGGVNGKCNICDSQLRLLLTSWYCPNEDDDIHKPEDVAGSPEHFTSATWGGTTVKRRDIYKKAGFGNAGQLVPNYYGTYKVAEQHLGLEPPPWPGTCFHISLYFDSSNKSWWCYQCGALGKPPPPGTAIY